MLHLRLLMMWWVICVARGSTSRLRQFTQFCEKQHGKQEALEMVQSGDLEGEYSCCVKLQAAHSTQRLFSYFSKVAFDTAGKTNGAPPTDSELEEVDWCARTNCSSHIAFYEGWDNKQSLLACTCKTLHPAPFESVTNKMRACVTVHASHTIKSKFEFFVTSFDRGTCADTRVEFQCRNLRCVMDNVMCDDVDNCGDATDEISGGCRGGGSIDGGYDETTAGRLAFDWWWVPLVVLASLMTAYWCLWRPGWLCWRLGCLRDVPPFCCSVLRGATSCVFLCKCGNAVCGRHPYKERVKARVPLRHVVRQPPHSRPAGEKRLRAPPPVARPPPRKLKHPAEKDGGGGRYELKQEKERSKEHEALGFVHNQYPLEEWSGMHLREGR